MALLVQTTTGFNSAGGNTNLFTSNFTNPCTAGNTIVMGVFIDSATETISAITDTAVPHNTYNPLTTFAASFGTIWLYAAQNITANSGTVYQIQVTESIALDGQILVQEWSGFPTSGTLLDSTITNSGTSSAVTTGNSIQVSKSNEVVISLMMLQSQTNTWSAGLGYSNLISLASNFTSAAMESQSLNYGTTNMNASFGMTNTAVNYIQLTASLITTQTPSFDTGGYFGQQFSSSGLSVVVGDH